MSASLRKKNHRYALMVLALACAVAPVAAASGPISGPLKRDFDGIDGCYADSSKLKTKISAERKLILDHVKSIQGSQTATGEGLNGLLVFKSYAPDPSEQIASKAALARIKTNIKKSSHIIPPPYGAEQMAGQSGASVALYTPAHSIPVTIGTAGGQLQKTEIAEWRLFDGSCSRSEWNYYFVDKVVTNSSDLFIVCLDSLDCVFKLTKLGKYRDFQVYQLIRPGQTRPDFLFAVDPRPSDGYPLLSLHILRSTPNGWAAQYSHDGSGCEGGC
ncbi:MAG: hypothetical protein RIQ81_2381 [Pseudomonadota bacterium]|jgi:hypothetical protein